MLVHDFKYASSIAALASTSRSLRDTVQHVRTEVCYHLQAGIANGQQNAKHLNSHVACSAICLCITVLNLTSTALLPSATAFRETVGPGTGLRIVQLRICCSDAAAPVWNAALVLELAKALPGLRAIYICGSFNGSPDLFAGLAECCPNLRELKVHLSLRASFGKATILGSLSALHGLTSLHLHDCRAGGAGFNLLMKQLAALRSLNVFGLSFKHEILPLTLAGMLPALVRSPLRCLDLHGCCSLGMHDLPALAAALPSLERLSGVRLHSGPQLDARALVDWHMPSLTWIQADCGTEGANTLGAEEVLRLAEKCPALQWLVVVAVCIDVRKACWACFQGAVNVDLVRRWVQGLAALAVRVCQASVSIKVGSAAQAEAVAVALEQLQLAGHCAALDSRIWSLHAEAVEDEAALQRLVGRLPHLRSVTCALSVLPALAPRVNPSCYTIKAPHLGDWPPAGPARAALEEFLSRRAAWLGNDAAQDGAPQFEDLSGGLFATIWYGLGTEMCRVSCRGDLCILEVSS